MDNIGSFYENVEDLSAVSMLAINYLDIKYLDIKRSKPTLLNFVSVLINEERSSSRKSMKAAIN